MQIALIHYASPPIVGGVETVLARQAQALVNAGHRVRVLTGRGETWDDAIPVLLIPLIDSRHPEVLENKNQLDQGCVPEGFRDLVDRIKTELYRALAGVEVLIAHNVAALHKNLALTAALYELSQEAGQPRQILWHHDLAWTTPRYRPELSEGWPWDLLRTAWPGARQVVVSQARKLELAELMGIPEESIRVVPAGIDLHEFLGLGAEVRRLDDALHFSQAGPILLTPVRLTPRKNLEQAIAILAALRKKLPGAVLIITGPPGAHNPANQAYFQRLKDLRASLDVEDAVYLLAEQAPGGLNDRSIADLFRLADALLLTSREEGFGIPILEAGLAGLPIFCTSLDALRALAGENGVYFSPDDPPEPVAQAISDYLASDPQARMKQLVRTRYTWEGIYAQQIAPLLEEL
jgi:glycosyltransferase involved in cell wall biosynthesis